MIDYCKFPHICKDAEIDEGVTIIGNVYIKEGVKIGAHSELRSDDQKLVVESNVEISRNVLVVNTLNDELRIQRDTTIGEGSKVFASIGIACVIGENCEIRVPISDGTVIVSNSIISAQNNPDLQGDLPLQKPTKSQIS